MRRLECALLEICSAFRADSHLPPFLLCKIITIEISKRDVFRVRKSIAGSQFDSCLHFQSVLTLSCSKQSGATRACRSKLECPAPLCPLHRPCYQMWQRSCTGSMMAQSSGRPKAAGNSLTLASVALTRKISGGCGSPLTCDSTYSGVQMLAQICA
jgi:hypothetical protein